VSYEWRCPICGLWHGGNEEFTEFCERCGSPHGMEELPLCGNEIIALLYPNPEDQPWEKLA